MNTLVPYAKPLYVPPVNAEEYFPLLLRTAGATGQITPEQYASLMRQMAHMLQAAVYRYSMGANSSVPYEKAQSLVLSQLYCLGFGLKQYPNTAQALQAVLHTPLHLLATQGRQQVTAATRSANHLWRATKAAQIQTPNRPYHDTIRGIGQFFRLYDVVYAANETPADIDYPLALPRWELCGVEYMLHYLQAFLLETRFLRYFKPGLVHAVLLRAQPTYATLPLNLCAPVLLCALGCLLSGACKPPPHNTAASPQRCRQSWKICCPFCTNSFPCKTPACKST